MPEACFANPVNIGGTPCMLCKTRMLPWTHAHLADALFLQVLCCRHVHVLPTLSMPRCPDVALFFCVLAICRGTLPGEPPNIS